MRFMDTAKSDLSDDGKQMHVDVAGGLPVLKVVEAPEAIDESIVRGAHDMLSVEAVPVPGG